MHVVNVDDADSQCQGRLLVSELDGAAVDHGLAKIPKRLSQQGQMAEMIPAVRVSQ